MKNSVSSYALCALAASILISAALLAPRVEGAPPTKWEYKVLSRYQLLGELYRKELGDTSGLSDEAFKAHFEKMQAKALEELLEGGKLKLTVNNDQPNNPRESARLQAALARLGAQGWQVAVGPVGENGCGFPTGVLVLQRRAP
tara:strand:- start:159 stop:590 length:432 start_codon:yes stop_codon:yes gene_type:complete